MSDRVLYRYFHSWRTYWNPDYAQHGIVNLEVFAVHRETERCWFIVVNGAEKRVLKGNGKRFAHERKEWAARSFQRRMSHEKGHYERALKKLAHVKDTLVLAWPTDKDSIPGVYTYDVETHRVSGLYDRSPPQIGEYSGPYLGYGA